MKVWNINRNSCETFELDNICQEVAQKKGSPCAAGDTEMWFTPSFKHKKSLCRCVLEITKLYILGIKPTFSLKLQIQVQKINSSRVDACCHGGLNPGQPVYSTLSPSHNNTHCPAHPESPHNGSTLHLTCQTCSSPTSEISLSFVAHKTSCTLCRKRGAVEHYLMHFLSCFVMMLWSKPLTADRERLVDNAWSSTLRGKVHIIEQSK